MDVYNVACHALALAHELEQPGYVPGLCKHLEHVDVLLLVIPLGPPRLDEVLGKVLIVMGLDGLPLLGCPGNG